MRRGSPVALPVSADVPTFPRIERVEDAATRITVGRSVGFAHPAENVVADWCRVDHPADRVARASSSPGRSIDPCRRSADSARAAAAATSSPGPECATPPRPLFLQTTSRSWGGSPATSLVRRSWKGPSAPSPVGLPRDRRTSGARPRSGPLRARGTPWSSGTTQNEAYGSCSTRPGPSWVFVWPCWRMRGPAAAHPGTRPGF